LKKSIFAVCDLEAEYAANFMDYLNQKKNIPFDIQAFTNVKSLLEFGKKNPIELLLISARAMCQEVRELEVGKLVILSEGGQSPGLEAYSSVYKYQSTSDVVREVMACYGEEKRVLPTVFPILKKSTEILGVYSPIGRCLKTSFALTLGQILAKTRAVLYLNLDGYAGFEALLGTTYAHTLSDLLYYLKQEDPNLMLRLGSMVQTVGGMDYLPPVQAPADILSVTFEEFNTLLQELLLHSNYDILVLDIGGGILDTFPLLDQCSRIYMPVLEDVVSKSKITQFETLLKEWDYTQVLAKVEKLTLPIHRADARPYVEQLPFGELGAYVKELLAKEEKSGGRCGQSTTFGEANVE
jgi:cellulose biosynthesis protein BcsQ